MLEPVRAEGDKGEVDGYFGMYDKTLMVNPVNFKKIETPRGMETTLIVFRQEVGFSWKCTSCAEVMHTEVFRRPLHTCKKGC